MENFRQVPSQPGQRSLDLPILMHHHLARAEDTALHYTISLAHFERQLDFLAKHRYSTLTFEMLFRVLDGSAPAPEKMVILTFDDGYESFHELALPALVARKITATVFLVANELGGFNRWDAINGIEHRKLMNETQIKEIIAAGMEIGVHGWNHRNLKRCSESELTMEITTSKLEIEKRFGIVAKTFSYPFGHYCESHFPLLAQAGYRGAVSIFSGEPTVTKKPFAMRRIYIHPGDGDLRFRLKLSPIYLKYLAWRGIP